MPHKLTEENVFGKWITNIAQCSSIGGTIRLQIVTHISLSKTEVHFEVTRNDIVKYLSEDIILAMDYYNNNK